MLRNAPHGIGGRIGRETPMWRPVRSAFTKVSSDQLPMPVFSSGVRFIVKLMPHGPEKAVTSQLAALDQEPPGSDGAGERFEFSGCPDRNRAGSSSGPFGPIFFGEWQSAHPIA